MKNLLPVIFLCTSLSVFSQGNRPYAVWEDQTLGGYKFVQLDAATGNKTDINTIPGVTAFVAGDNSAIDAHKNRYHFAGMSGGVTKRLYTLDIATGNTLYNPVLTDNIVGLEYNCSDSLLYAIRVNGNAYSFVTVDPVTATVTTIASVLGMSGYISGSFSLDVNQGLYNFVVLSGPDFKLRSLNIQTGAVVNDNIFPGNIAGHRYNCEDGFVYGLWEDNNVYKLEKIDVNAGTHTTVNVISGVMPGWVGESASVNASGQYTYRGFDSLNNFSLIAIDLANGSVIDISNTSDNAVGFDEACCCSMITSVKENISEEILVYPNPSSGNLLIKAAVPVERIEIVSITGSVLTSYHQTAPVNNEWDISFLPNGTYFVKFLSGELIRYYPVILQR